MGGTQGLQCFWGTRDMDLDLGANYLDVLCLWEFKEWYTYLCTFLCNVML